MKKLAFIVTSSLMLGSIATAMAATSLPGNTNGAQVIHVENTRGRIDTLIGIVYSQI